MYHMIVASSLVFLAVCAPSLAYVDGARNESCYNHSVIHLQPFTNLPAELITCNDPCIFQVDVRLVLNMTDITDVTVNDSLATTYERDSTYQVTIKQAGPNGFQGFLIQARDDTEMFDPSSNIYGEWMDDSSLLYKPLFCGRNDTSTEKTFNNSATQRTRIVNDNPGTNLTVHLYWTPGDFTVGNVSFWYTIVQQQPSNYLPVKGPVLRPEPSTTPEPTTSSPTTSPSTTSSPTTSSPTTSPSTTSSPTTSPSITSSPTIFSPTTSTSTTRSPTTTPTTPTTPGLGIGAIIGIAVGGGAAVILIVVVLILLIAICVCYPRRSGGEKKPSRISMLWTTNPVELDGELPKDEKLPEEEKSTPT